MKFRKSHKRVRKLSKRNGGTSSEKLSSHEKASSPSSHEKTSSRKFSSHKASSNSLVRMRRPLTRSRKLLKTKTRKHIKKHKKESMILLKTRLRAIITMIRQENEHYNYEMSRPSNRDRLKREELYDSYENNIRRLEDEKQRIEQKIRIRESEQQEEIERLGDAFVERIKNDPNRYVPLVEH